MGSRSRSGVEAPAGISAKVLTSQLLPVPSSKLCGVRGTATGLTPVSQRRWLFGGTRPIPGGRA